MALFHLPTARAAGRGIPPPRKHVPEAKRDLPGEGRSACVMNQLPNARRLSVAPMMDWTDRHCRFFHRLLSRRALLYTEMVTTGALLHGDVPRHLDFDACEHPVALQLRSEEHTSELQSRQYLVCRLLL